jgi:simple sugar transport system substrate-binding protein
MKSKLFEEKGKKVIRWFLIFGLLVVVVLGTTMCAPAAPTEAPTEAPEEAPTEEMEEVPEEEPMEEGTTLAIEHFSIIEGTTWSGAQDRAG